MKAQDSAIVNLMDKAYELRMNQYYQADSLAHEAFKLIDSNKTTFEIQFDVWFTTGLIKAESGFYEEAGFYFKTAEGLARRREENKLMVKAGMRWAENEMDLNRFDKAVAYALELLNKTEQLNDTSLIARVESNLAEIYRHAAKLELAEEYNLRAIQKFKKIHAWNDLARCYNNLSTVLGKNGRNREAIDTLKRALTFVDSTNYFARGKHNSNIAYCFRNLGEYDSALYYNSISLKLKRKIDDIRGIGYSLGAIGRCYIGLGETDSAISYIQQSLDTALKYRNLHSIKDATQYLSDAYRAAGDFEKALKYQDLVGDYDDSIYVEETARQVEMLQQKYEISKKEREIERLKSERRIESANQRTILAVLLALLLGAILLAMLFRLRAKRRMQRNKLIEMELKNSQIELEQQKFELKSYINDLMSKNKVLKTAQNKLLDKEKELEKLKNQKSDELEQLAELKILTEEDWKKFKLLFDRVHPTFFEKLNHSEIHFTKGEKRLMALVKLDMNLSEVADTLGISSESVSKSRFRLKKKLMLKPEEGIDDYVHHL